MVCTCPLSYISALNIFILSDLQLKTYLSFESFLPCFLVSVQYNFGSLRLTTVAAFTSWESANATNQGFLFFPGKSVVKHLLVIQLLKHSVPAW